jgi:hypothetical protein
MSKRRSIGERINRAKSLPVRRDIALEWAALWQDHHHGTIARLERAIGAGRLTEAAELLGDLKVEDAKRFTALPGVIEALSDEDV